MASTNSNKTGSKKSAAHSHTYLEKLVSKTKKFKVEDLLDLYGCYDSLVSGIVFRLLLFPYTRFARTWLRDQARDLLAGTDRNRLILTSRFRKSTEAGFEEESHENRSEWASTIKPRHTKFLSQVFHLLHKHDDIVSVPTQDEIESLGVSRLVYDDMGAYYSALMNSYPAMVADWCSAKAEGEHEECVQIDCFMRALEAEVGILRDDAWYVTVNVRSIYDQIEKMVQHVTMAYARLLFRFAHRLRGVTSTEENFSAGYEGMIRAARNYDPVDGSSFTAHCQWWVRSAVLQRQRQSSVISLPTTTWYQLSLLQKGQIELSHERVSDLRERAEMFYANSANANKATSDMEDVDEGSFESIMVTSPDAQAVLGDSILHAQAVEEAYEAHDAAVVGRELLEDVLSLLHDEDPSLIFPVLLWALNSGIDATMLAEVIGPMFLSEQDRLAEKTRHQKIKAAYLNSRQPEQAII
jgi:DNA-directed RNA polymerase specialized sigma subunit